jgi:hypothetical protein
MKRETNNKNYLIRRKKTVKAIKDFKEDIVCSIGANGGKHGYYQKKDYRQKVHR